MSKQYKIIIVVRGDDQYDMFDGDYSLEEFRQIARESLSDEGHLSLRLKATSITVEEND